MNITGSLRKYNIEPIELACIALFILTDEKTFSWQSTIGVQSNTKNATVMASRFFARNEIQIYLYDHKEKLGSENKIKSDSVTKEEKSNTIKHDFKNEISSDNIQELLELEYNKTTKQEKRVELLMKIAEFVGAKKTTEDSANLPVIYLPARCKECSFRTK